MQVESKEFLVDKMSRVRLMCDAAFSERGAAPPIVLCYDKDGRERVLIAQFEGPLHREKVLMGMRMYFSAWQVRSYIFVSEAWAITRSAEQLRERRVQPSQADDRREILMILGVSSEGVMHHASEICRDESGKVWLDDSIMSDQQGVESMGGELTELLPPPNLGPVPENIFYKFEKMRELGIISLTVLDDGIGGEDTRPTVMGAAQPGTGDRLESFIREATRAEMRH